MSEEYRDCDSRLSTVRKKGRSSAPSLPGRDDALEDRDDALQDLPVESTVVLPGSTELRSARPAPTPGSIPMVTGPIPTPPALPVTAPIPMPAAIEPSLTSTGESFAVSLPPPGAALIDTMRIPREGRRTREKLSFHVALTVAMLGVTIGLLSGRAMPTKVRTAAAPSTTGPAATTAPAATPAARTVASEVTPLEGTVRGKAVRPVARGFMAPSVARRPAAPSSSTGPSAAEVNESLSALAEAQAARPF